MKSNITYLKKLELFKELDNFKEGKFLAIADYKVKNHLPQWIAFSPYIFWLKNPEEEKDLETYKRAVEFFLKQGISRSSTLYAFGGGATTDFAGFVASTILRGVKWIAIPSTLLAIIDGSIGGKVALNMAQGKNLIGAFHNPEKIFICGELLSSLPENEWLSGKGEVLKYGFLSKEIFELINKKASIDDIAFACAKFKSEVVERDFLDKGERVLLNLGHTLGHAFEKVLKIPHGQAVAMGMKYLFEIMNLEESTNNWELMVSALALDPKKFSLESFPPIDKDKFFALLEQDKKKSEKNISLVLVKSIGHCYIEEMPMKDFVKKIQTHADFKD